MLFESISPDMLVLVPIIILMVNVGETETWSVITVPQAGDESGIGLMVVSDQGKKQWVERSQMETLPFHVDRIGKIVLASAPSHQVQIRSTLPIAGRS